MVKGLILHGQVKGFALCVKDWRGEETVYLGGEYENTPDGALRAALDMSMALNARKRGNGTG